MFVMYYKEKKKLPDSMCLDSGTTICEYTDGNDKVGIEVRGCVTVTFNGEVFRHYSDMPKELQQMFEDDSAYSNEKVEISENNWYEVFFNSYEDYDVAECIDGYTSEELEAYCKECMAIFRGAVEPEKSQTQWQVILESCGVEYQYTTGFDTEDEANAYADAQDWYYIDDIGYEWHLEVRPQYSLDEYPPLIREVYNE